MFGVEPLARIVRQDARIEVKVPAAQGRKAYSYFREGGEGEVKKPFGGDKKLALVGGGLALAGLGAAALAMSRKKSATVSIATPVASPISETKSINDTARNAAIGVGAAGLGVAAAKIAASKKKETEKPKDAEKQESEDKAESLEDIAKKPDTAHIQIIVPSNTVQKVKSGQALSKEEIESFLDLASDYRVSDYKGARGIEGTMNLEKNPPTESIREAYINIIIPKNADLAAKKDKDSLLYMIKSSIEKSGGILLEDPQVLSSLKGLKAFQHT